MIRSVRADTRLIGKSGEHTQFTSSPRPENGTPQNRVTRSRQTLRGVRRNIGSIGSRPLFSHGFSASIRAANCRYKRKEHQRHADPLNRIIDQTVQKNGYNSEPPARAKGPWETPDRDGEHQKRERQPAFYVAHCAQSL